MNVNSRMFCLKSVKLDSKSFARFNRYSPETVSVVRVVSWKVRRLKVSLSVLQLASTTRP